MTDKQIEQEWRQGYAIKYRYEKRYAPVFYKALREQKAVILATFKDQGPYVAYGKIAFLSSKPLEEAYREMYRYVVPREADRSYSKLSRVKFFGINIDWLSDISTFLDDYILNRIVLPMTARTMERMYRVIENGLATGQSYDEMLKNLTDTEIDRNRARLIARTESTRATNFATNLAGNAQPFYVDKVWIAAKDNRTRGRRPDDQADHYHMAGQTAMEGELFTDPRNGAQLSYPGDSANGAPAGSVVNCRCSLGQEPRRDADGRLVMKPKQKLIPAI